MFENLSIGHLAVVLVIVLLLFGAKRIPEIAGSLGKGIKEFKGSMSDNMNGTTNSNTASTPRDTTVPRSSTESTSLNSGAVTQAEQNAEREPKRLVR